MIPSHSPTERQSMATALRSGISYPPQGISELSPPPSTSLLGNFHNHSPNGQRYLYGSSFKKEVNKNNLAAGPDLSKVNVSVNCSNVAYSVLSQATIFNQDMPGTDLALNKLMTCKRGLIPLLGVFHSHSILEDSKPSLLGWGGVNLMEE